MIKMFGICFNVSECLSLAQLIGALIGAAIGAFLGFLGASRIYNKEREDHIADQRQLDSQLVKTALLLIQGASAGGRKAEASCKALAKQYKEHPYGLHLRTIHIDPHRISLDRLDRERLLRAYRSLSESNAGWNLWRRTCAFSDGINATLNLTDNGIVVAQKELYALAQKLKGHMEDLMVSGMFGVKELRAEGRSNKQLEALDAIISKGSKLGSVGMDELKEQVLDPIHDLFNAGLPAFATLRDFVSAYSKAWATHYQYGQKAEELMSNLLNYATDCAGMVDAGEKLYKDLENTMNQ